MILPLLLLIYFCFFVFCFIDIQTIESYPVISAFMIASFCPLMIILLSNASHHIFEASILNRQLLLEEEKYKIEKYKDLLSFYKNDIWHGLIIRMLYKAPKDTKIQYYDPWTGQWMYQDGVGAWDVEVKNS